MEPRRIWRCLLYKKGEHAPGRWRLERRCHFDRRFLSTGSGYDRGMTRVGLCGGQSSSWLWRIGCHDLKMTGSRWLTMGSDAGLQRRSMNGFKCSMEMVCGGLGASSEWMVTTFSATGDASVMIKGPMKLGWILFPFRVLIKRTRSLMVRSRVWAFRSKYSLLTAVAVSRLALIFSCILSWACVRICWYTS
uniref:Uncharacterized protein n=1 Tax=Romanomermis culicivorax TaxID=13658 RepID=A0A915IKM5_ROMCU